MRHPLLTLTLALPLSLAACDSPDEEAMLEALEDAELQEAEDDDEQAPLNGDFGLTSNGNTAWKCHCWTNCSSDGVHWTKMYWVGSYATKKICNAHAKSFCHGKANDYTYPNAGCGKHP